MHPEPAAPEPRAAGVVASVSLAAVAIPLLLLVGRPLATDDLWWHLKLGEVYAEQGPWLGEDPLYHTTRGRPTVPHEWLFQVGVHGLRERIGFQGLRVVHVFAVAAMLAWAFRIFRRAGGSWARAALATSVLALLSWFRLFQFRPDLVSLAATLALTTLIFERDEPPSWTRAGAALALLVVWANAHSLFAIGLALLLAAALGVLLRHLLLLRCAASGAEGAGRAAGSPLRTQGRALLAVLALGVLLTAVNPRGFEQHATFLIESASGDIWHLQDDFLSWNPFRPAHDNRALTPLCWIVADALLLAFVIVAGAALLRVARDRSPAAVRALDPVHLGLATASLVAMLVAVRFHWLALFPLVYLLRASRRWTLGRAGRARAVAWSAAGASVILALALPGGIRLDSYVAEVAAERDGYWKSPYLDERYCGAGTRFLRDSGLRGRLFHPFNLGGFLAYWLAPELRTFIDGRMDHYPSEVLDDYLSIRHTSQAGAGRRLQQLLDKWEIDVFFGTSFPESRYPDRFWIEHLRRLPGWVPVFTSQTHSVYLRRTKRNAANFLRAMAYYRERRLPFSVEKGFDAGRAIRRRPAWAMGHGLVPPHFERLQAERSSPDPGIRATALAQLGQIYWQVGAFREQVEADAELVALVPDARVARRRLADGLLHLDRLADALEVAEALLSEHPDDVRADLIRQIAAKRAVERED